MMLASTAVDLVNISMANAGIVNGYNDGSFGPGKNITRAEFAAIAARFDPHQNTSGNAPGFVRNGKAVVILFRSGVNICHFETHIDWISVPDEAS